MANNGVQLHGDTPLTTTPSNPRSAQRILGPEFPNICDDDCVKCSRTTFAVQILRAKVRRLQYRVLEYGTYYWGSPAWHQALYRERLEDLQEGMLKHHWLLHFGQPCLEPYLSSVTDCFANFGERGDIFRAYWPTAVSDARLMLEHDMRVQTVPVQALRLSVDAAPFVSHQEALEHADALDQNEAQVSQLNADAPAFVARRAVLRDVYKANSRSDVKVSENVGSRALGNGNHDSNDCVKDALVKGRKEAVMDDHHENGHHNGAATSTNEEDEALNVGREDNSDSGGALKNGTHEVMENGNHARRHSNGKTSEGESNSVLTNGNHYRRSKEKLFEVKPEEGSTNGNRDDDESEEKASQHAAGKALKNGDCEDSDPHKEVSADGRSKAILNGHRDYREIDEDNPDRAQGKALENGIHGISHSTATAAVNTHNSAPPGADLTALEVWDQLPGDGPLKTLYRALYGTVGFTNYPNYSIDSSPDEQSSTWLNTFPYGDLAYLSKQFMLESSDSFRCYRHSMNIMFRTSARCMTWTLAISDFSRTSTAEEQEEIMQRAKGLCMLVDVIGINPLFGTPKSTIEGSSKKTAQRRRSNAT